MNKRRAWNIVTNTWNIVTSCCDHLVESRRCRPVWVWPDREALSSHGNRICASLGDSTSTQLKNLIGNAKIVIIDEAQRVKNIGLTLKLIIDQIKEVQLITSGSSSLELANSINELLTGRKFEYFLYPLYLTELHQHFGPLQESKKQCW